MKEHDISTEDWREYVYGDGSAYRIEKPKRLLVKDRENLPDSHRVVDENGVTHYPNPTWVAVRWEADPAVSF